MYWYDPNQHWGMDGHYPVGKGSVSQKRNDWEGLQGYQILKYLKLLSHEYMNYEIWKDVSD